ncbi:DEAD/DEAH box helicase family protein [Mycoplasmopsis verecunda]|uniref:Type III restriction enzyme n=1 Tax=Mycoplasmopsis verecunda TaxID=171291 RepID=A0A1T4LDL0_9BACT|nr:DEAD/DEAH box helicase family protein [Mycoplasmopsis verecunda]WPB54324.1 DEAD/DEAH box helicase family protein [Mycoplasmopsis verecunda]SJZ52862.1 type III restriction enzyme [Mycoplasmopsis verecunda]
MITNIKFKKFQQRVIESLTNFILDKNTSELNNALILKSPTGSGKTLMLLQSIVNAINNSNNENLVFVWITPGKGDLEQQSYEKMIKFYPEYSCAMLDDALNNGFQPNTTYFINWEKITKSGNKATRDGEVLNIHDQAFIARENNNYQFIAIIDEEHYNNTKKAYDFLNDHIKPYKTIKASATTISKKKNINFIEVSDREVIDEELITRSIFINPEVKTKETLEDFENEALILINTAENKRVQIADQYEKINSQYQINPLVLIQMPNKSDEYIEYIKEDVLRPLDITTDNGKLAIWLDKTKINLDDIENNNSPVQYLIFKQSMATGWDCPRSKILIKLRDNMSEDFEIQTIGRIRRMPHQKHFDNDLLDNCFLYTFDAKFKDSVIQQTSGVEVTMLSLKSGFSDFKLPKEERNDNQTIFDHAKWKETLESFYDYMVKKYDLKKGDFIGNLAKLEMNGYNPDFSYLHDDLLQGQSDSISPDLQDKLIVRDISYNFNLKAHHNDEGHTIDKLRKILGINREQLAEMFNALWTSTRAKTYFRRYQIIDIANNRPSIFMINNREQLAEEFRNFLASVKVEINHSLFPEDKIKRTLWYIPFQDLIPYDSAIKKSKPLDKNVYKGYDTSMITTANKIHSWSEKLFEEKINKAQNVKWYYKNGDKGKSYFSIMIRREVANKQQLFYPDYILQDTDDNIWIIETKGGIDFKDQSKDVDKFSEQKYESLKMYVDFYNHEYSEKKYNLKFAFGRDHESIPGELFLLPNHDKYIDNLNSKEWIPMEEIFK